MSLKSLLTTNIEMKLFSALLAAALWLLVALEANDEVEIPLAVSYLNTPPGLAIKVIEASGPVICLEGPRILLLRQKLKGVPLRVDLAGAGEGSLVFSGVERQVKLMQGVKMIKISPVKVELHR